MKRITGVYAIRNLETHKAYVGSAARSMHERWNLHRSQLSNGIHHSRHLQSAWNKYGSCSFEFVLLELCDPSECVKREQVWIDRFAAANKKSGYNTNPTAGSSLGRKLTKEHKRKIGKASRGKKHSAETKAKLSATLTGRVFSVETLGKMSRARLGKKRKPHSMETKAKMSVASKGRKKSKAHCRALSLSKLGKPLLKNCGENHWTAVRARRVVERN